MNTTLDILIIALCSLLIILFCWFIEFLSLPKKRKGNILMKDSSNMVDTKSVFLFGGLFILSCVTDLFFLVFGYANTFTSALIMTVSSFFGLTVAIYMVFNTVQNYGYFQLNLGVFFILLIYPAFIILLLMSLYFGIFRIFVYSSMNNKVIFTESTISNFTAGIVTFFGVMTTGFIAFNSHKQSLEKQKNDEKKLQSTQISVAVTGSGNGHDAFLTDGTKYLEHTCFIDLNNFSNLPIYDVFIFIVLDNLECSFEDLPSQKHIIESKYSRFSIIRPGSFVKEVDSCGPDMGGKNESVCMLFRDSNSVYWYKSNYGHTIEISKIKKDKILLECNITMPYRTFT